MHFGLNRRTHDPGEVDNRVWVPDIWRNCLYSSKKYRYVITSLYRKAQPDLSVILQLKTAALLVIYLILQTATLVHASEHVFHHEDPDCEVFQAFQKTGNDTAVSAVTVVPDLPTFLQPPASSDPAIIRAATVFSARAPPVYATD